MSKHTPGPWKAADTKDAGMRDIHDERGHLMRMSFALPSMADANAALVAAAPELLEELKRLTAWVETMLATKRSAGVADMLLVEARAAIAKAEGKS